MGALVTRALRPLRNFNVENRAHRELDRERPRAAPGHPAPAQAARADPPLHLSTKSEALDRRLREVYVTAPPPRDERAASSRYDPARPLPQNRSAPDDFEFGVKPPDSVPYGRTTLKDVMRFVQDHQINPVEFTVTNIARAEKLKEEDVADVIKYFKTFEIYLPKTSKTPARFAGPAQMRQLVEDATKRIGSREGDPNT